MKLIITQPEIEAIVRAHVENTVQLREGAEMKIDFTATRSDDGITATIDIPYMGVAGIPAIAAANEAAAASTPATPIKGQTRAKQAPKGNAAAILGGGTTPATDSAANPEPVDETSPETAQDAASGDQTTEGTDAPAETADAAQDDPELGGAEAAAPSRGPSLFGSFLAR